MELFPLLLRHVVESDGADDVYVLLVVLDKHVVTPPVGVGLLEEFGVASYPSGRFDHEEFHRMFVGVQNDSEGLVTVAVRFGIHLPGDHPGEFHL